MVFSVLLALYAGLTLTHRSWLPFFAKFLSVEERVSPVDLVVSATATYSRFRYALDLIQQNPNAKLLLLGDTRVKLTLVNRTKLELAEAEALEEGIAPERLRASHSTSTRHDAQLARQWALENGWASAVVISDAYNMRRVRMVFESVFADTEIILGYQSPDSADTRAVFDSWWRNPTRFSYVVSEWIKFPINSVLLAKGSE